MRDIDLEKERKFENAKALGEDPRTSLSKFYWATALNTFKHQEKIYSSIKNKNVLEIGCASGFEAVLYCNFASQYTGVDISDKAIENCKKKNINNAKFYCTDGHKVPFKDQTFDCVIVNSLLHHMDLETSFLEIKRVLKDDGLLLFREPLGTNPLIRLYRKITPKLRTDDERPFTFKDLRLMQSHFSLENIKWIGFLSIISAFCRLNHLRSTLSFIDHVLSKTPLKYFYWQFAGEARKKNKP